MITQTGITPEGKPVVAGVYRFFETHGIPLGDLLGLLNDRGCVPDWLSLYDEALAAGMKRDRILSKIEEASCDGYGADFTAQVMKRLRLLR